MPNYYCEYCGHKASSVAALVAVSCFRHPDGSNRGKHKLFEGAEASSYTCKYCGTKTTSLSMLTATACFRHPNGANKGKHSPALR
jgi:DNA-directed RNA polymerase subunit RPC12/RpoP